MAFKFSFVGLWFIPHWSWDRDGKCMSVWSWQIFMFLYPDCKNKTKQKPPKDLKKKKTFPVCYFYVLELKHDLTIWFYWVIYLYLIILIWRLQLSLQLMKVRWNETAVVVHICHLHLPNHTCQIQQIPSSETLPCCASPFKKTYLFIWKTVGEEKAVEEEEEERLIDFSICRFTCNSLGLARLKPGVWNPRLCVHHG